MKKTKDGARLWAMVWALGLAGQLCWNMENQWFNTFVYARIAKDPTIISWMVAVSAAATTFSISVFSSPHPYSPRKRVLGSGYCLLRSGVYCFFDS